MPRVVVGLEPDDVGAEDPLQDLFAVRQNAVDLSSVGLCRKQGGTKERDIDDTEMGRGADGVKRRGDMYLIGRFEFLSQPWGRLVLMATKNVGKKTNREWARGGGGVAPPLSSRESPRSQCGVYHI